MLAGLIFSEAPAWVQTGTVVEYIGNITYLNEGQPPNTVDIEITYGVVERTDLEVNTRFTISDVTNGVTTLDDYIRIRETEVMGTFSIDKDFITNAKVGDTMGQYTVLGERSYGCLGKTWTAVALNYEDPKLGISLTYIYDKDSGILLETKEVYPSYETHFVLKSDNGALGGEPLNGLVCLPGFLILLLGLFVRFQTGFHI